MPKAKSHRKHVACLEGFWDDTIVRPLSVRNLFETASYQASFHVAHLSCNTLEELQYNLDLLHKRRGYGILYFAFHGERGRIRLPSDAVLELEDLADRMQRRFRGWVVHFGSCSTIAASRDRLDDFLARTGAAIVLGYEKNVDWIESASTDLLLFYRLQDYVDMGRMWKAFRERYGSLVSSTGLRAYPS